MRIFQRRILSVILAFAMVITGFPAAAFAQNAKNRHDLERVGGSFVVTGQDGSQEEIDNSDLAEKYPYGVFALGDSQLTAVEGGKTVSLKVYRLGGTTNKASAILSWTPAIASEEDGSRNDSYAIKPEDVVVKVEDPQPAAAYQPWGGGTAPKASGVSITAAEGTDLEGEDCMILSPDEDLEADSYQWYVKIEESWMEIKDSDYKELPVSEEDLEKLDFRCVYTLDGESFSTDSLGGEAYEEPEEEEPEVPEDLPLNAPKTYSTLELEEGKAMLFEVCFADGEYEKEILITAVDNDTYDFDRFAAITIEDHLGASQVHQSLNTLLVRIEDNDAQLAEATVVGFEATEITADKSEGSVLVTVKRTAGDAPVSVSWHTEEGTAEEGMDFAAKSGVVKFGVNDEAVIEVPLINDQIEDLEGVNFDIVLTEILGDSDGEIEEDRCTVTLINSNTAETLNMESILYDADVEDVSGKVKTKAGASVAAPVVSKAEQVTASEDQLSALEASGIAVEPLSADELSAMEYNYAFYGITDYAGRIKFDRDVNQSTVKIQMSHTGDGNKGPAQQTVEYMHALYTGYSTDFESACQLASGWNRFWYGDYEFAYSYFKDSDNRYVDCSPQYKKSGSSVSVSYKSRMLFSANFGYDTVPSSTLYLGLKKADSRGSADNITTKGSVTFYKRPFNGDFYINLHTANDPNVAQGSQAVLDDSIFEAVLKGITVSGSGNGGIYHRSLLEGSTLKIELGNTHYQVEKAELIQTPKGSGASTGASSANKVMTGDISGNGTAVTFGNMILDPDADYTFNLAMTRKQRVMVDFGTSAELDQYGNVTDAAASAAYSLFKNRIQGGITLGLTQKSGSFYALNRDSVKEVSVPVTGFFYGDSTASTSNTAKAGFTNFNLNGTASGAVYADGYSDIQYICFNLPETDIILFNGRSYKGSDKIYLRLNNLTTNDLQFYYYNEDFLTVQRPMKVKIDAEAVYFDGNGNGRIDGYWDAERGLFFTENGDRFLNYLENKDYEETSFRPIVDEQGRVHQYFLRPYFTANPVSLSIPDGHSADEMMQIMPNFSTDTTNGTAYEKLTPEQKAYRAIVSGQTRRTKDGSLGYSADDHVKYTEAATAYSYVDIPLGGDTRPVRPYTYEELKSRLSNKLPQNDADKKNGTVRYKMDGSINVIFKDQIGYYYDSGASQCLGDPLYIWEPLYYGNLLTPFEEPQQILIPHSLAGDDTPIADVTVVEYQLENGTWTETAPDSTGSGYTLTNIGVPITRTIVKDPASVEKLNNYLGSFADNDTYALIVNEQTAQTEDLMTMDALSALADTASAAETVTRGQAGVFPDSSYLTLAGGSTADGEGGNEDQSAYSEVEADFQSELFSFDSELFAFAEIETDGYEISISIGIPLLSKDNGGDSGSAANTFDDVKECWERLGKFKNALKDTTKTASERRHNAWDGLAGDDLDAGNLKSKSVEVSFKLTLAVTLKYNHLDARYQFDQATLALGVEVELRLTARFTGCPIFYLYFQWNLEGSVATGLGMNREAVLGDAIFEQKKTTDPTLDLYEFTHGDSGDAPRTDGKDSQYAFLLDKKAFDIKFSGKLNVQFFTFVDKNGNGKLDGGNEIGSAAPDFKSGYISSDGKESIQVFAKGQKEYDMDAVVVVLTAMDTQKESTDDKASIVSISPVIGAECDYYWAGFAFEIETGIEVGAGVGIEIAKAEIFFHASIGIAFTLGSYEGDGNYDNSFDSFELNLGIGFRVVFLFFNYEQDLISYTLEYDKDSADDDHSGWSHSWSALGGKFGDDIGDLAVDTDHDGVIDCHITIPTKLFAQAYSNGVNSAEEMESMAYTSNAPEFQVSGFGATANAFKLLDGTETGYDYRLVTANGTNYVVVTGTDSSAASTLDRTRLELYRIAETDNKYGLVSPIKGNTEALPVALDGDGTGDLDFTVWSEGDLIKAAWISYDEPYKKASKPSVLYSGMTAENYLTCAAPAGGRYENEGFTEGGDALFLNGEEVTAQNFEEFFLTDIPLPPEPEEDHYDSEGEYQQALEYYNELMADYPEKQQAVSAASAALSEWATYFRTYAYFASRDEKGMLFAAAGRTVVKVAQFDTTDPNADSFSTPVIVADANGRYDFMPKSAEGVVLYGQSVPFTKEDLAEKLNDYSDYIDDLSVTGNNDTQLTGDPQSNAAYIAATKQSRMDMKEAFLNLYGGNSKLTVVSADGMPLTNGEMYVSNHQEGIYADAKTSEILVNMDLAKIGETYFVSYMTQENRLITKKNRLIDESEIDRLYLRSFTVENDEVVWSDPYLLRTVINYENDSADEGVFVKSSLRQKYQNPYMANLKFLNGRLGNALPVSDEDFEIFADAEKETFLVFEMNGSSYVIRQSSLEGITSSGTGTINEFFTPAQIYGEEAAAEGNLNAGKLDLVIGSDGDGNIAAVYTSAVANTTNNAIYLSYWDPETAQFSAGVMLAMNRMDVYEQAIINGWTPEETRKAYLETAGADLNTFSFKNLQVALGRRGADQLSTMSGEDEELSGEAYAMQLFESIGMELPELDAMDAGSEYADLLLALSQDDETPQPELLILTQGILTELYEYTLDDGTKLVAPKPQENGAAEHGDMGIYAISYGKGGQLVGNPSIRFAYNDFKEGSRLYASVSFTNIGDAAIRASKQNPVKVKLMLKGASDPLAEWKVMESIGSGQVVKLATDKEFCKPLPSGLGAGDYFYLTVEEDASYIGNGAYTYSSETDPNGVYKIQSNPDLSIEYVKTQIVGVDAEGNAIAQVNFDVANRGSAGAEDVYLQVSYVDHYETNGATEFDEGTQVPVYKPFDLTESEILISQPKYITADLETLESPQTDLANGIIRLGTDDRFYTGDYYITDAEYQSILSEYYTLTETTGYAKGYYNGMMIWYNSRFHVSAYAAYTAGQKAVEHWVKDEASGSWYKDSYKSMTAAVDAAAENRKQEYIRTAAQYAQLPEAEKSYWHVPADDPSVYVPTGFETLQAANDAFEAAKTAGDRLDAKYCRTVNAKLFAAPSLFNGKNTGSLELKLEVFSASSNASVSADGLYICDHKDEAYDANNTAELALEQASFISAAPRINLARGSVHRLPVSVETTTGEAPVLTILEVEDGQDELTTLYFTADEDGDGVDSTMTGYLTITGAAEGSGVIHIVDTATNTIYPVTYQVVAEGDGINVYNDDAQFSFYNADSSPFDPDALNQDWKFTEVPGWTDGKVEPYLGNLSVAKKGAYYTFETKTGALSLDVIGEVEITSSIFPGAAVVSGTEADPTTPVVAFNNTENLTHVITVKVLSDEAYIDIMKLTYSAPYTPSDDTEAPGLYWSRSFPEYHTVPQTETVELTVYAVDETGLQNLIVKLDGQTCSSPIEKSSSGLWSQTFTVSKDVAKLEAEAVDTNGNRTYRDVTVLWFAENVLSGREPYGQAPSLTGTVEKTIAADGSVQDVLAGNVVFTSDDVQQGNSVAFSYTSDLGADLVYEIYDSSAAAFADNEGVSIASNGVYLVRSEDKNYNTWRQEIFAIDCFESMPVVNVSTSAAVFDPNTVQLNWAASKDETSMTKLTDATINGIKAAENKSSTLSGAVTLSYGGDYTVIATDEKNISGAKTASVVVPVYDNADGTYQTADPWGTADENGICGLGSITIDFSHVSGGKYANKAEASVPFDQYYGSYEYAVVKASEAGLVPDQKSFEDGDYSWLAGLTWLAAGHTEVKTVEGLTAPLNDQEEYIVLIRDAQDPDNYRTYAQQHLILTDISISVDAVSGQMASIAGAEDGKLFVSADRGHTGMYEFAVLPSDNGTLTAEDFMAEGVQWIGADPAGDGTQAVFENIPAGTYQIAVRALAPAGDAAQTAEMIKTQKRDAETAAVRYESLVAAAEHSAEEALRPIANAGFDLTDAILKASEKEAEYLKAEEALSKGSKKVTAEQVDLLKQEYDLLAGEVEAAKTALKDALLDAGFSESEADSLTNKRAEMDPAGSEIRDFNEALGKQLLDSKLSEMENELSSAEEEMLRTEALYMDSLAKAQKDSAESYEANEQLWSSLIISKPYTLRAGEGTSLTVKTKAATSKKDPDGKVIIDAAGGSSYDGTGVFYQYAVYKLPEGAEPVDYSGNMAAIADLGLDWQFGDDLADGSVQKILDGLEKGDYQIFVRPVYDPDPLDSYDVNREIAGDAEDSLANLQAVLNEAKAAADEKKIQEDLTAVNKLLAEYKKSEDPQIKAQILAMLGGDADAAAALDAVTASTTAAETTANTSKFKDAAKKALTNAANAAVKAAESAYDTKAAEISRKIEEAYANTPGYYDTASYANASVGYSPKHDTVINEIKNGDTSIFEINGPVSDELADRIIKANETKTVVLDVDGNKVILPEGTADKRSAVRKAAAGITGGRGNTVGYTAENGEARIAPICIVHDGKAVYVYMGGSDYRLMVRNSIYNDTNGHWAAEDIEFVSNRQLFEGVGQGRFAPASPMTRAMVVTVLHRFAGKPAAEAAAPFSDVPAGTWYSEGVAWAYEQGIVDGVGQGMFAPDAQVTREQLVTMIARYLKAAGFMGKESDALEGFADTNEIAGYAKQAFEWACGAGIVQGNGLQLMPKKAANRAEVAAIFHRVVDYILANR